MTDIIAPMLKVAGTFVIGLSTMGGPRNYYDRLFDDPDPEMNHLFIRIRVDLVCDRYRHWNVHGYIRALLFFMFANHTPTIDVNVRRGCRPNVTI
jgi:hypothetical protein